VKAAVLVVALVAGLVVIPDRLLSYLSPRVGATARDALMLGYEVVAFVILAWAFVALQRGRGRR
jgi:hypothetical protein